MLQFNCYENKWTCVWYCPRTVKAELLCAYVNYGVVDSAGLVCRFLNWKTAVFSSKITQNWYVVLWQFCDGLHCNMWDIIQLYEDSIIYKVTTKKNNKLSFVSFKLVNFMPYFALYFWKLAQILPTCWFFLLFWTVIFCYCQPVNLIKKYFFWKCPKTIETAGFMQNTNLN